MKAFAYPSALGIATMLLLTAFPASAESFTYPYGLPAPDCEIQGFSVDCNALGAWANQEARGYISTSAAVGEWLFIMSDATFSP